MPYPTPSKADIDFFWEHGWIVVKDVIPQDHLDELEQRCEKILAEKHRFARDWAWEEGKTLEDRSFRIVQSSPSFVWREIRDQPYRKWLVQFGSGLLGKQVEFWYDQFLAKPPGKSVPTYWHQDEAYWGRNLDEKGITGWIPLLDVNAENGCMHFIDGGHRLGVLPHHDVAGMQSDIITCDVDESKMVVCPISRGDVTFHHSKTPHMTTANVSKGWRKAISNHMQTPDAGGEGDHYPWKKHVLQQFETMRPAKADS